MQSCILVYIYLVIQLSIYSVFIKEVSFDEKVCSCGIWIADQKYMWKN